MMRVVGIMAIAGAAATLMVAPAIAAGCIAPTADAGGVVNAHTRYLQFNLLPAIVQPSTKPSALEERMHAYQVPA